MPTPSRLSPTDWATSEPVWLGAELVLDIHSEQLALLGGPDGLRDRGLLKSVLARPANKHAHDVTDLATLAASYAFGIARNRPFVDGNKRVAFASFLVFLGLNGRMFRVAPAHATASVLALAAGEIDEEGFARWVRDNL